MISPPYQYAKDTIDEPDTPDSPNPENLTDKIGKIAEKTGRTAKEIRKAIHEVKKSLPRTGPVRNPDVTVDVTTGEVYPKTPGGGIGDSIGNIFDHLKDVGGRTP